MAREILSEEKAREFADLARDYIVGNTAAHKGRPSFVLGFARELEMDLKSADVAFKRAEEIYDADLVRAGYRYHVGG